MSTETELSWIRDALSLPRFASYLRSVGGDMAAAIELYWWNVGVSSAFYAPLHSLEVSLRNAVHPRLADRFGRADWWTVAPLNKIGRDKVKAAKNTLVTRQRSYTPDDMVTELSFGFWASLTNNTYERSLWVPALHKAFPFYRGPRPPLNDALREMRYFRNRIMHHEPIHYRHLEADHETLLRVLGYVSPAMANQLKAYDQVQAVLRQRPRSAARGGAR